MGMLTEERVDRDFSRGLFDDDEVSYAASMDQHMSMAPPVGDYDAYMAHVKLLANPVFASVEESLMFIKPTPREKEYIMRALALGTYQLTADCGWWEVYLIEMGPRRRALRQALLDHGDDDWDETSLSDDMSLPLSREEAVEELSKLETRVRDLRQKVAEYKAKGHYWSALPLLRFMRKAPENRQGYGFEHLLPPLLHRAMQAIYAAMPAGIGFGNRQAVGSQQMMDEFQQSNFNPNMNGRQRPRVMRPKDTNAV